VENYWLYDWIDEYGITRESQAEALLRETRPRFSLRDHAEHALTIENRLVDIDGPTIVAGRPIDVSGQLDCANWECIKKQIDTLFGHVLHYFDRIVVAGPSRAQISRLIENQDDYLNHTVLVGFIKMLLYVREIGADDFLVFREKPALCERHIHEALKAAGLELVWSELNEQLDALANDAKITLGKIGPYTALTYQHPLLSDPKFSIYSATAEIPAETLRKTLSEEYFLGGLAALGSDIVAAQKLGAPLGTTIKLPGGIMAPTLTETRPEDVAFQMDLPVLSGISPKALLKLRRDESLSFERFRHAMRTAIQERLRVAGHQDAAKIANDIRSDIIEPALRNIDQRLRAAKSALGAKISTALIVAALPTICGIYTSTLILAAAGLPLATGSVLTAAQKYIDEKAALKSENMYFLWQAQGHADQKHT